MMNEKEQQDLKKETRNFFGDGFFAWQFSNQGEKEAWEERQYNEEKYWGGFSRQPFDAANYVLPDWAIGPFEKYPDNPVFAPDLNGWDRGHFGGGVHNGSVLAADARIPEEGYSAEPPHQSISHWRDTVVICGMTLFRGKWHAYYGGSEYYTCLAMATAHTGLF